MYIRTFRYSPQHQIAKKTYYFKIEDFTLISQPQGRYWTKFALQTLSHDQNYNINFIRSYFKLIGLYIRDCNCSPSIGRWFVLCFNKASIKLLFCPVKLRDWISYDNVIARWSSSPRRVQIYSLATKIKPLVISIKVERSSLFDC